MDLTRNKIIVVVLLILVGILAISLPNKENENKEITVRYLSIPTAIFPFELADQLGYLKEKGIKLERAGTTFSGPESIIALDSGSVDIASAATPAIINAVKGKSKLVSLWVNVGTNKELHGKFFVLKDSNIQNAKDLIGKKIGVNTLGAHLDFVMREYLKKNGLTIKDVQLVVVPDTNLEQVLLQKQVDVIGIWDPNSPIAGKLEESGKVRLLFTDYDVLGEIAIGFAGFNKEFIEKNPKVTKDFVEATAKAIDYSNENPDQARKYISKIIEEKGGNPDLSKYWNGFGIRKHGIISDHDVQFWIDALVQNGKLNPGEFKPSDIYTNDYNPLNK